jgi:3-oxoacyl-[acyl-carrier protein] reductase
VSWWRDWLAGILLTEDNRKTFCRTAIKSLDHRYGHHPHERELPKLGKTDKHNLLKKITAMKIPKMFKHKGERMSLILKDKVAIITGAGRGIGRAFALKFAEEGAKLFLPDISLERAESVANEIKMKGGQAVAIHTDISDENATTKMAKMVTEHYGKVDILVNNAAIYYGIEAKPWNAWTVKDWDQMFSVNVCGTWLCCKAIAPLMIKQSTGKIINVASDIFKSSDSQFFLPYALSKASVYALTQSLASALGPSGINVNAIGPGYTASEASLSMRGSEQTFKGIVASQFIRRREEPTDVVGTGVFLASKDSDFLTGQLILVNGGRILL